MEEIETTACEYRLVIRGTDSCTLVYMEKDDTQGYNPEAEHLCHYLMKHVQINAESIHKDYLREQQEVQDIFEGESNE